MIEKVLYLSPRDMRKNRADSVHIMFMCDAFFKCGKAVELVAPTVIRDEEYEEDRDISSLYGINIGFKIIELPTVIRETVGTAESAVHTLFQRLWHHTWHLIKNIKRNEKSKVVIYSKCWSASLPYIILRKLRVINTPLIFEVPFAKDTFLHRFVLNNSALVVACNKTMAGDLKKIFKVDTKKIIETPQRYPMLDANKELPKNKCRELFGFNKGKTYIMYAGKTGVLERDIFIIEAAKSIPDCMFVIVGANKASMIKYKEHNIGNIIIFPFQPIESYANLVRAADVLIGYYEDNYYNRYYITPGKSGYYLSSDNPVIFSDFPSLRDRFSDDIVFYAKPGSVGSLVKEINNIIHNPEESTRKSKKAKEFIQTCTYEGAAKFILFEIESRLYI